MCAITLSEIARHRIDIMAWNFGTGVFGIPSLNLNQNLSNPYYSIQNQLNQERSNLAGEEAVKMLAPLVVSTLIQSLSTGLSDNRRVQYTASRTASSVASNLVNNALRESSGSGLSSPVSVSPYGVRVNTQTISNLAQNYANSPSAQTTQSSKYAQITGINGKTGKTWTSKNGVQYASVPAAGFKKSKFPDRYGNTVYYLPKSSSGQTTNAPVGVSSVSPPASYSSNVVVKSAPVVDVIPYPVGSDAWTAYQQGWRSSSGISASDWLFGPPKSVSVPAPAPLPPALAPPPEIDLSGFVYGGYSSVSPPPPPPPVATNAYSTPTMVSPAPNVLVEPLYLPQTYPNVSAPPAPVSAPLERYIYTPITDVITETQFVAFFGQSLEGVLSDNPDFGAYYV